MIYKKYDNKLLLCKEHSSKQVDAVFLDLSNKGLIATNSSFFEEAKNRTRNTVFYLLYPFAEIIDGFLENNDDFFLMNTYLFSYSFFLDHALDALENNPSTRARATQISSYLISEYLVWLNEKFKSKSTVSIFYSYFQVQSEYLIAEKKWNVPEHYVATYGSKENIAKKAYLLLFPLELLKEIKATIYEKFINYYSYVLLADDLSDFHDDINGRCLTYPISVYFKLTGKLPQTNQNITLILSQCIKTLNYLKQGIEKHDKSLCRSILIEKKLFSLITELKRGGINI